MVEQDTIRLLRECDAGIKMGVDSIEDVVDHVKEKAFRGMLVDCKHAHQKLQQEIDTLLEKYHHPRSDRQARRSHIGEPFAAFAVQPRGARNQDRNRLRIFYGGA